MPARYYLRSFGCQMNEHDAERIRALLEAEGLERADAPEAADVLVYNTCTVRKSADDRLAGHLGTAARLKREDPGRVVLVTGCLPQAEQQDFFTRFPFVDGALGPQNLHRLPDLLAAAVEPAGTAPAGYFEDGAHFSGDLAARRARPFQAWVQVMSGCTNFCSYCIVPYVRGPERSRALDDVVAEVEGLAAAGVREITLLGQNVNAYGLDLRRGGDGGAPSFAGLLERLDAVRGIDRIRFMTSHPRDLGDDLVAAVAKLPSVCEHVHLPAQAGSDRVLAAMRRGYTASRTSSGCAPCVTRSPTSASPRTSSRASPARPKPSSPPRSTWSGRRPSMRRTRSCSRRARARPPRNSRTRSPRRCGASAWSA